MPKATAMSTRRTSLADLAESITIRWIEQVETPPASLAYLVSRYRDLQFYNHVEDDSAPTDMLMNAIYDDLVGAAVAKQAALLASQYLHMERPAVPLRRQWDAAIAEWRGGQS
jgi:hypothetical protein